ncbi:hypothetical protein PQX77_021486 [Marasmius sp. AFHP31]|nr:hypothetical protein PQX77_021486 [Marasmius sp. AFHP31]
MTTRKISDSSSLRGSVRTQNTAEVSIYTASPVGASHKTAQHGAPNLELDTLYHLILTSSPDPNKNLVQILAAILILPSAHLSPSPKCIELVLGLSRCVATSGTFVDTRGREDEIRFQHTSFTEYLLDRTRSGRFYTNVSAQKHGIAREWLRSLAVSRIGTYSADQLENDTMNEFLTGYIGFCASLPVPTSGLLDQLQNVDLATVFFCKYRYRAQDAAEREIADRN